MKLVGVQKIVSKKTGSVFAKLSFIDDSPKAGLFGAEALTEWLPFDQSLTEYVGLDVSVVYSKGSNGKAYAQSLTLL